MISGDRIAEEARRWVGTPYVHQGRTRFGVDCVGLIVCVRHAVEPIPAWLEEQTNYRPVPSDDRLLQRVATHCDRIETAEQGCLIVIKWPYSQHPAHVALFADGNMIHAYGKVREVVEHGYRGPWLRQTHSLWRLPGVRQ